MKRLIIISVLILAFFCGCKKEVRMEGPCERCGVYCKYSPYHDNNLCYDCIMHDSRTRTRNKNSNWWRWILIGVAICGGWAYIEKRFKN